MTKKLIPVEGGMEQGLFNYFTTPTKDYKAKMLQSKME
jgi:hypothetical protein